MQTTALNNQSLLDIALQVSGSAEAAYDVALENGKSITDELTPGQELKFTGAQANRKVVNYYTVNNIKPATDFKDEEQVNCKIFDETFDETFE